MRQGHNDMPVALCDIDLKSFIVQPQFQWHSDHWLCNSAKNNPNNC